MNTMQPDRLRKALELLKQATGEVDAALEELRGEKDPLALHIFRISAKLPAHAGLQERQATAARSGV